MVKVSISNMKKKLPLGYHLCIDSVYGYVRFEHAKWSSSMYFLQNCTPNIDTAVHSVSHRTNCQFVCLQGTSRNKPYTEYGDHAKVKYRLQ